MDTTSAALSRTLHVLATHHDMQNRLRSEIIEAKRGCGGDLPYDELVSLPYLDAICREILRLYPPVSTLTRTTRKDVILPLSMPILGLNGLPISEVVVPAHTNVTVSILAANRNPAVWGPDALEFKPERWLAPLPETVLQAHLPGIYSHMMTFSGGGRACIGFKFSQLEMKVVLSELISTFEFLPSKEKICWNMNGITTPAVEESSMNGPQMPIMISLVNA
ncbi:hypothetical protein HGRIS_001004 [Hohenbuehelia grisea]|uniref:Cytochrome P450 n=1 Tax=Hohenbuehelia grisea TaxID=104357 RepID=A0ABR3IQJ8_9AGAR